MQNVWATFLNCSTTSTQSISPITYSPNTKSHHIIIHSTQYSYFRKPKSEKEKTQARGVLVCVVFSRFHFFSFLGDFS